MSGNGRVEKVDAVTPAARGRRVRPTQRAGTVGTAVQGGFVVEKEKNPQLTGLKKYTTYSELLANVEIVGACVRYFLNMVGKASWTVEPAEDGGARAEEIAAQVESILYDMERPWHRVVRRAAMYRVYGFSWQEWIAKRRPDGAMGFFDVEPRTQSTIQRWDVDDAGIVYGVWQESPQSLQELYLPREKSVYVVDDTLSDAPDGFGLMRHVAPAAMRLQAYERLEGTGFETDLRGIPVGRAPYSVLEAMVKKKTISQAQMDAIVQTIEGFVTDHVKSAATGIVLDSMVYKASDEGATPSSSQLWGLDLLTANSTSQDAIANSINRLVRGVARLFGCEGILLGETGSGSLAMSRDKSQTFGLIVDGSLVELAGQFEKDLLGPLAAMNGWPEELIPSLKTEKLQHRDVVEIAETLEALGRAGAPLDPADEAVNVVREILGLPMVDVLELTEDASLRRDRINDPQDDDAGQNDNPEGASASRDNIDPND